MRFSRVKPPFSNYFGVVKLEKISSHCPVYVNQNYCENAVLRINDGFLIKQPNRFYFFSSRILTRFFYQFDLFYLHKS